jgi:hypothetical protein
MVFGFRRSRPRTAYDDFYDDPYGDVYPGERIGRPLPRAGGRLVSRGMLLLCLIGAGWAVKNDPTWLGWSFEQASALVRAAQSTLRELGQSSVPAAATARRPDAPPRPPPLPPLPTTNVSAAVMPAPAERPAEPALITGSLPSAAAGSDAPADEWRPPRADPADPLQVRAEAVGLHPELSRALLARLSEEDFGNAEIAVNKAVAETPDSNVFVWPRQRKPELAHFQVRFVAGAAPNCRRYVVIVTKDRWSTTALPMERCGAQPKHARRG